jgi:ADP-ribose pyrophosphatase YjhB (NUDIX family)
METWDGRPVSEEPPFGVSVVVWRPGADGPEFLVVHRAHEGPDYEGEWAWTPPSGARLPGEDVAECARRELFEETGLRLECEPTACGSDEWAVFAAEAPTHATVVLDAEHDRFSWLTARDAVRVCLPASVGEPIASVAATL